MLFGLDIVVLFLADRQPPIWWSMISVPPRIWTFECPWLIARNICRVPTRAVAPRTASLAPPTYLVFEASWSESSIRTCLCHRNLVALSDCTSGARRRHKRAPPQSHTHPAFQHKYNWWHFFDNSVVVRIECWFLNALSRLSDLFDFCRNWLDF